MDTLWQALWSWSPGVLLAAIAIGAAGGIVRGVTGFGAAMVMAPPLAMLVGPRVTVAVVLLLEGFAAAPMLAQAARLARWRVLAPIVAAAALCMPAGSLLLTSLPADWLRRAIAFVVLSFSVILLTGLRWKGSYRTSTGLGLGAVSGTMLGATGIGGPPVILYLLSGPDDARTTRATLAVFIAIVSALGLATQAARGVTTAPGLLLGLAMMPLFMVGVVFGSRIFSHLSEARFRRVTILLLMSVSAYVLLS
jgi:uncharacterized membrane protein YfcA